MSIKNYCVLHNDFINNFFSVLATLEAKTI